MKFDAYPKSWYALCTSTEIKPGKIIKVDAFNGSLAVFRSHSGIVGVLRRHCPHMGTDLTAGKVKDGRVVCPFHYREFGSKGECLKVWGSDEIPPNAHTISLPVEEAFGLVFVFLGNKVEFAFPKLPRVENKEEMIFSSPANYYLNTPYYSLLFNGFDTHHLNCIHNREVSGEVKIESPQDFLLTADYSMKVAPNRLYDKIVRLINTKENVVHLDCWGGNLLYITLKNTKDNIVITSLPISRNRSRIFLTSVTKKGQFNIFRKFRLALSTWLGVEFLKPDIDIIENMRPENRALYSKQDQSVIKFWQFWDNLPRNLEFQEKFRHEK